MITRTCYLQSLLGSLASEREREEEDEIDSVNWYVFIIYSMPSLK